MAFWKNSKLDPLRKYRFQVQLGDILWWAKSVTQPSPDISTGEYQLINHVIKYPGIVSWNDVDITIVEIGSKGIELYNKLKEQGYGLGNPKSDGIKKQHYKDMEVVINKIDADGKIVEVWTLYNVFIKSLKYGDLAYSDDELLDIIITLSYDSAKLDTNSKSLFEGDATAVPAEATIETAPEQ